VIAPASFRTRQQGHALLLLMLVMGLVIAAYLLSAFDSQTLRIAKDQKTAMALADAKTALIGWSAGHATMPGSLPCPDINNTGSSGTCTATSGLIGRLPWKTLGVVNLTDGSGECLWYAVSPLYRNTISVSSRLTNPVNSTTPGTIGIVGPDGTELPAPANAVVAVIMAPGDPLPGQERSGGVGTVCGGNTMAANYLEAAQGINNATGNAVGNQYKFIAGTASSTFNDKLIYITLDDLYRVVKKRMVKEILGNVAVHSGPVRYYDKQLGQQRYPCPSSSPNGNSNCANTVGFVNNSGMGLQYAALGSWLNNNGWFGLAAYTYLSPVHVQVRIADASSGYSCDANANVFTCASP
jgi:hypothetical protein